MINNKSRIKNTGNKVKNAFISIIKVASSNMITVIAGVFVGFIIPKIFSVVDYGYYKQFSLYCTYIGLFSIGIADGIVLKYGNYNLDMLNKEYFHSVFRCFFALQVLSGVILIFFAFVLNNSKSVFLIAAIGLNIVAMNVSGFFQQVSQITQRFNEYAIRNIIKSILSILTAFIMLILYIVSDDIKYQTYIVLLLISNYIIALWYMFTYKELIFGKSYPMKQSVSETKKLIRIGFPLMCANLCSTLILTIDRQFVSVLFSTSEYAIYAFAYNLLSLVTAATSACAVVFYPILTRSSEQTLKRNYYDFIFIIFAFCFIAMGSYYPLFTFIRWYLPNYIGSLEILRIIFPGLAITSSITIVIHNYYKTLKLSTLFFQKSIVIIVLSVVTNTIAFAACQKPFAISIASIFVMIFWYEYTNRTLEKKLSLKSNKNVAYLLTLMICFYFFSYISNMILGFFLYELVVIGITLMFGGKRIIDRFRTAII